MIQIILILLLSVPIFQYRIYWLLVDIVGVGYAYFIDQFLPLIATSIAAFVVIKKYVPISAVKKYVAVQVIPILIIVITSLVVHGWILGNYFMGEEPTTILLQILNTHGEALVGGILRGYHYGIYVLSYQLFYTKAVLYNGVALGLYILTAIILYIFLNLLLSKKVIPALVGTLFFVTTPAYMDMFFWQSNFSGMPIALSAGIVSLIFLLHSNKLDLFFYQKTSKFLYYVLSLMFYLSMLKIGFVRLHAFIALPLYMCLFPAMSLRFRRPDIKRFALSALPFLCIFLSFLLTVFILPGHVFEKGITVRGATLNTEGYLVVLSMLVAYLFIPSQVAESYYPYIKEFLLKHMFIPTSISLTLFFGVFGIGVLVITGLIALRYIRQSWGRLVIFAILTIFAHLVLTPLFLQGYNDPTAVDQRFSNTGVSNGPGIRYVFVSAMGLSLLVAVMTHWVVAKHRKYMGAFLVLMFSLLVYYSYLNRVSYISALKNINPTASAVPNSIFAMVPKDGKKKLLYSANPERNTIDGNIGDWLHAFYKIGELEYVNSLENVRERIVSGIYEKNNFYAFYNNPLTQTFKDVSELARQELYDNRIDQDTTQLIRAVNLTTSYTETDNHIFPLVLNRGIYSSEDFSQRILSPRKFSILIQKRLLPVRYPYVDGYEPKENHQDPFALSIWDTMENKPLFVSIKSLDGALVVKSLRNQTINKLPSESRLNLARVMKDQAMSDIEKINKHYIDSQEILNTFLKSPSFNSLALVYACAEDVDWDKQKKSPLAIGGIWYVKEFPLNNNKVNEEILTPFTCFGSKLRQIILVGPPIPSEIIIAASVI